MLTRPRTLYALVRAYICALACTPRETGPRPTESRGEAGSVGEGGGGEVEERERREREREREKARERERERERASERERERGLFKSNHVYELLLLLPAEHPGAAEAFYRISVYALDNIGHPGAATRLQSLPPDLPLLVLWGQDDKFVDQANAAAILQTCADRRQPCKLVLIPGASHCAHDDNPARVTEELAIFLQGL